MYKRGTPSISRTHGHNYIRSEAKERLAESVRPQQDRGLNALAVDAFEVLLFLKKPSARICTCRKSEALPEEHGMDSFTEIDDVMSTQADGSVLVTMDWHRPLFGDHDEVYEEDQAGLDDFELVEEEDGTKSLFNTIESSPDCGICYRSGYVPGYELYGQQRHVFVPEDLVDHNSITVDRAEHPNEVVRLAANGYAEFEIAVPRYFKSLTYSVRHGYEILNEKLFSTTGAALTLQDFKSAAGRVLIFRVAAERYTHAVITFDLGTEPVFANIAQMANVTDWTNFSNIGNLNVILPMTIPELPVGSFIIVKENGFGLRITDVQYLKPTVGPAVKNIDWSCNTRVMQPQEPPKAAHKGYKMF